MKGTDMGTTKKRTLTQWDVLQLWSAMGCAKAEEGFSRVRRGINRVRSPLRAGNNMTAGVPSEATEEYIRQSVEFV